MVESFGLILQNLNLICFIGMFEVDGYTQFLQ